MPRPLRREPRPEPRRSRMGARLQAPASGARPGPARLPPRPGLPPAAAIRRSAVLESRRRLGCRRRCTVRRALAARAGACKLAGRGPPLSPCSRGAARPGRAVLGGRCPRGQRCRGPGDAAGAGVLRADFVLQAPPGRWAVVQRAWRGWGVGESGEARFGGEVVASASGGRWSCVSICRIHRKRLVPDWELHAGSPGPGLRGGGDTIGGAVPGPRRWMSGWQPLRGGRPT